jgi:hypothetical protein
MAVTIRVLTRFDNRLLGGLEQFATRAVIALRLIEDFLMARFGSYASFNSGHFSISS